ncbi:MAG: hypothetical protein GY842_26990 [bacterium]|nr:hypothetical protein [bacterium]
MASTGLHPRFGVPAGTCVGGAAPKCRRAPAVFGVGVAIFLVLTGCSRTSRETLTIATLNLAHGRGVSANPIGQVGLAREQIEGNLSAVADVLRREAAHVVCLQEADTASTWSGGFDHVAFLADAADYPHHYLGLHVDVRRLGVELRYGTALLSQLALADAESHAFRVEPTDTKGCASAGVDFSGRPVRIVSLHLDFKSAANRRRQARAVIERFRAVDIPLVIAGDFNSRWESPGSAVRMIAEALHLRVHNPEDAAHNTYPAPAPNRRIDWILISNELEVRSHRSWTDQVSDHLGVTTELTWR